MKKAQEGIPMNILTNFLSLFFIKLLIIFVVAFGINTLLFLFLPKTGVEFAKNEKLQLPYQTVNLVNAFKPPQQQQPKESTAQRESIDSFVLKAIYAYSDNTGFIMISQKSKPKDTELLGVGEFFAGYRLDKIFPHYVIFKRDGTEYVLHLGEQTQNLPIAATAPIGQVNQEVVVSKADIQKYTTDFDAIWQSIAIKETRDSAGIINGFEILSIRRNSAFDRLGLKAGDIIKKVNNVELKSYADAFNIYNNINRYQSLKIEILRDNKSMEIHYEIN